MIDGNLCAAEASPEAAGEAFNIACGTRISLNELLAELRAHANSAVEATHTEGRPGDIPHSHADIGKARQMLGFEPAVGITDGLGRTFAHYEELHRQGVSSAAVR